MKIPAKDIAVLSGLSVLIALLRLHTYDEPLERDITCNAVCADEFLTGRDLYIDLFHPHSPAVVWAHAAFQTIFGYNEGAVYALGVVAAIVTMLGIYAAASAGQASAATGLWAAAFWVAVCGTLPLQANQPNAEVYMNACIIWALAVLMRDTGEGSGLRRALMAGAFFAMATFCKQVALPAAPALALAHIAMPPGENPSRPRAVRQTLVMAAVGAVAWLSFFGYYRIGINFETFWDLFVNYNLYYAGNIAVNFVLGFNPGRIFPPAMYPVLPLFFVVVLGAALRERGWPTRAEALTFASLLACPIMVALPGKFFMHYYQLWLPPLAVAAARALDGIHSRFNKKLPMLMTIAAGAVLATLAFPQFPYYTLSASEWSRTKYETVFIDTRRVGKSIGILLLPDEKLYNWGMETGLYFYSRRRPASGLFLPHLTMLDGPLVEKHTQRTIETLSEHPPELLAVSAYMPKKHPVLDWFYERYEPLPDEQRYAPIKLYFRRGGALEKRLQAKALTDQPESGALVMTSHDKMVEEGMESDAAPQTKGAK